MNPRIEPTPGIAAGKPRIAGHRITVEDIVIWHEHQRKSSARIADEFDLTPPEEHTALAYYRYHRPDIDRAMKLGRQYVHERTHKITFKIVRKRITHN